jgi:hypothetical protein
MLLLPRWMLRGLNLKDMKGGSMPVPSAPSLRETTTAPAPSPKMIAVRGSL